MKTDFSGVTLESFCRMLNDSACTNFVLKKVKVLKAERNQGLALIGADPEVTGVITVVHNGEKRIYHFKAGEFEIFGD